MDPAFYGLDPLFGTHIKLFIKDVLTLDPTPNAPYEVFNYFDHIIRLVEICGIIVAVEIVGGNIIYTVDDASGTIGCCLWRDKLDVNYVPLGLGTAVLVRGKIRTFQEKKQIGIYDIFELEDPNDEMIHYIRTMTLEAKYRKPYCLPETIESNREILLHRLNNPPVTEDYKFVNFTREVLGFLRGNKEETFSIWLPRQDPGLIEGAKNYLEEKNTETTDTNILRLFEETLKSLSEEGYVFKSKTMDNMFVLGNILEIQTCIADVISETLDIAYRQRGGVQEKYIAMRAMKQFNYLNKNDVHRVLKDMVFEGYLHTSEPDEYLLTL